MSNRSKVVWLFERAAGATGLLMVACGFGGAEREPIVSRPNVAPTASAALSPLPDCASAKAAIRAAAIREMHRQVDQQVENAIQNIANYSAYYRQYYCNRTYDTQAAGSAGSSNSGAGSGGASPPSPSAGTSAEVDDSSAGASQTSGTNNQVAGVDEADFVKNDNVYIYTVTGKNFRIVKAWPATEMREIARIAITGTPRKLFVNGNRAVVYSSVPSDRPTSGSYGRSYRNSECTYGYSCDFTGDGNPTRVTVLDITDKAAPRVVREIRLTGSYVNARRIGTAIHTVVSAGGVSPSTMFPGLRYYDGAFYDYCNATSDKIRDAGERLRRANLDIINAATLADIFPAVSDTKIGIDSESASGNLLVSCDGFYAAGLGEGSTFTTLLTFDMTTDAAISSSTIVSKPGAVYASADALYVAVPAKKQSYCGWYGEVGDVKEATNVHKFKLGAGGAPSRYVASGVVKGHVLNQFAMDERDGFLRIATSVGRVPDPNVTSALTVFREESGTLVTHGQIDGLAPKEDIRSVRFNGDRGYVVTFKKTDPLFVFDLSNPADPKVMAELKIPGFSTYMHPMDDAHLLTIGYDADDHGSFAYFSGIQIQIFDVTDARNPQLKHKTVIGTRGSSSEALTNHLAFTFFASKNLLALPMTICEDGGDGSYGRNMTFSGLMVFNVTTAAGISERGRVSHPHSAGISCGNWWTDAKSEVRRSIFMDDYVFSISDSRIKANQLDALATDLAEVPIAE
ncbi:MAG: beta-propeller domain-containing protein [Deltaproteobacteria bacterium]|nr:beta-propeller domain-containing protein [Deltaproteobacteria bacterium]